LRIVRKIVIFAVIAAASFFISMNIFNDLKAKGYDYLFYKDKPYDLVLKNTQILDGTGQKPSYKADIAILDGIIAGIGKIDPKDSPVFEALGLTVIPEPYPLENKGDFLEHVFSTSYPRYEARHIYLQEGAYKGLNLEQAAEALGTSLEEAFEILKESMGPKAKAWIIEMPEQDNINTVEEYLARLTGYRAIRAGQDGQGVVRTGAKADLYMFLSKDYSEGELLGLLKKGQVPEPIYIIRNGEFVSK